VQVDPIKPTFIAPGRRRSKLKYDEPLSSFALNLNLRCYSMGGIAANPHIAGNAHITAGLAGAAGAVTVLATAVGGLATVVGAAGRGLHSFTLELNLSNSRTHSGVKSVYTVGRRAQLS
jgi:hypothetical protein